MPLTPIHGSQAELMLDEFDISHFARSASMAGAMEIHDATGLGQTSRIKVPGAKHATSSAELFVDITDITGSYAILTGRYGGTSGLLTLAPKGFAVGNPVSHMYAKQINLVQRPIIDDLQTFTYNAESEGDGIDFGVSLHAKTTETAGGNSASVDNGAATANGGVAVIHVYSLAGGNLAPKVQDSSNGTVWTDLAAFTTLTAIGKQRIEVTGAVKQYLRLLWTKSTADLIGFAAAFARR